MGGNAISNVRRIDQNEFYKICFEIITLFPELHMTPVISYEDKETFGDIDFVVEIDFTINIPELVRARLDNPDEYHNGMYYSFNYKNVQIDFICHSDMDYVSAFRYYNFNDISNLLGRVARSLNFKLGHDGLSYDYYLDMFYKVSINVTRDYYKALEFLGYDSERYMKGFKTLNEIFEYVVSSPYFNSLYFSLENQNHDDRTRNRKRKVYQAMLKYISDHNIEPKCKLSEEELLTHLNRTENMFGKKLFEQIEAVQHNYDLNQEFKQLFNGNIVNDYTGLEGKELGKFMKHLKGIDNFKNNVLEYGEHFVSDMIRQHYLNWSKK